MEHYKENDRIEGLHCELYCRKETVLSSLQRHPISGKMCMRAELSRNATAEISKELQITAKEKNEKYEKYGIYTNIGDRLVGDALTIFVEQKRPIKFTVKEGATHRHGARFASTTNPTLCEIKYAQEHIRNAEVKRLAAIQKLIDKNKR